jgi:hypothetical protein
MLQPAYLCHHSSNGIPVDTLITVQVVAQCLTPCHHKIQANTYSSLIASPHSSQPNLVQFLQVTQNPIPTEPFQFLLKARNEYLFLSCQEKTNGADRLQTAPTGYAAYLLVI